MYLQGVAGVNAGSSATTIADIKGMPLIAIVTRQQAQICTQAVAQQQATSIRVTTTAITTIKQCECSKFQVDSFAMSGDVIKRPLEINFDRKIWKPTFC